MQSYNYFKDYETLVVLHLHVQGAQLVYPLRAWPIQK